MASMSVSKRQQARNERELQELLRVPGNNVCADCSARNPGWASWNLGIFLCMRCASLHRKMGTHISKVKSLSMDTWSSEQVENMNRNGNTAVNKVYNPKNKKPDIPLDADEVDSAMERFIRKKYQEKSLESGRPEPPSRSEISPTVPPKSPTYEPAAPVAPPKKHRFFGFGLRASSSSLPSSKHDKKKLPPEPRVDSAWPISGDDYRSLSGQNESISEAELQLKLTQLKDMGFPNRDANTKMLRRMNGDIARTIDGLVRLGPQPAERSSSVNKVTPQRIESSRSNHATAGSDSTYSGMRASHTGTSNNPFEQSSGSQPGFGLSMTSTLPSQQEEHRSFGSNNPFDIPARNQTDGGLVQSFQNMQLSHAPPQPLFPHNTGGFAAQQYGTADPRMQTMTPPSVMPEQHGYTASPLPIPNSSNPFFQQPHQQALHPQQTGTNPFMQQSQAQLLFTSQQFAQNASAAVAHSQQQPSLYGPQQPQQNNAATNPFMLQPQQPQSPSAYSPDFNPFGIPPAGQPQQNVMQPQQRSIDSGAQIGVPGLFAATATNPFQRQMSPQPQQQTASSQLPNFHYGQQQTHPPQAQQHQFSPYSSLPHGQDQYMPSDQLSSMTPQQTGRFDKNSILALYNYPTLAPAKQSTLSSIPEPGNESDLNQQTLVPGQTMIPRRSATMPVSMGNMHSAGGGGNFGTVNRNPFLQNSAQGPSANTSIMSHSSRDSMVINNLEGGRHSPDAFANLSARYG